MAPNAKSGIRLLVVDEKAEDIDTLRASLEAVDRSRLRAPWRRWRDHARAVGRDELAWAAVGGTGKGFDILKHFRLAGVL